MNCPMPQASERKADVPRPLVAAMSTPTIAGHRKAPRQPVKRGVIREPLNQKNVGGKNTEIWLYAS
jgi:hypothetical protein